MSLMDHAYETASSCINETVLVHPNTAIMKPVIY